MKKIKSKCCGAGVVLRGTGDFYDQDDICTCYYVCTFCSRPCDIKEEPMEGDKPSPELVMEEELKIIDTHECNWANQHKGMEVIKYDPEGWTLFADHSKMIREEDDEAMEYRISISYCPFCGLKL